MLKIKKKSNHKSLIMLLLLAFSFSAVSQNSANVAVIDLEMIVAQSSQGQALMKKLENFQKQVQSDLTRLQKEAQELQRKGTDGSNILPQDELQALQKQFESKMTEIRRISEDKQREGEKMKNEGLQEIEKNIQPSIEKIKTELAIDILLNKSPGIVLFASDKADVTQQVLKSLNASK